MKNIKLQNEIVRILDRLNAQEQIKALNILKGLTMSEPAYVYHYPKEKGLKEIKHALKGRTELDF